MIGLDRNLGLLFILGLAVSISLQLVNPLFPLFLDNLNATEIEISYVISLANIVATAAMIPSGFLMDRAGTKKMLIFSIFLSAIPSLFIPSIDYWIRVIPLFMIFNSTYSFFGPARMAAIAASANEESQATLFGYMNIDWPLGGMISPFLSGLLVERYGWRLPFLSVAVIMSISLIPALLIKEKGHKSSISMDSKKASVFKRKHLSFLVAYFIFQFVISAGQSSVMTILPIFLQKQSHLKAPLIGLFFSGASFLTLLTQIPSGWLADRYGNKRLVIFCLLPIPLIFGSWSLTSDWVLQFLFYTLSFGLWSMTWPATLAMISDNIPSELRGRAYGIRMAGIQLGFTAGPLIAGFLYSSLNPTAPFTNAALLYLAGIPLVKIIKEEP